LYLFESGGILMYPILLCSVVVTAVIINRLIVLRQKVIAPPEIVQSLASRDLILSSTNVSHENLNTSPLGRILQAGIAQSDHGLDAVRIAMEETASEEIHHFERFLTTLGSIASVAPLLGLLGTVFGMIEVFATLQEEGIGDPSIFSGGIAEALLTTAFGLSVAIPSLLCHRYFQRRIDVLSVQLEKQGRLFLENSQTSSASA